MTIKPTTASDRGNGKMTIRVEGDDVEACRRAADTGETIELDEPAGSHWRVVGCTIHSGAGFFDVEAVDAPAPVTEDDVTEPSATRRRAKRPPDPTSAG